MAGRPGGSIDRTDHIPQTWCCQDGSTAVGCTGTDIFDVKAFARLHTYPPRLTNTTPQLSKTWNRVERSYRRLCLDCSNLRKKSRVGLQRLTTVVSPLDLILGLVLTHWCSFIRLIYRSGSAADDLPFTLFPWFSAQSSSRITSPWWPTNSNVVVPSAPEIS